MPRIVGEDLADLMRNRFYGLVFPTYSQAKLVAWEMLKFYAAPIPGIIKNEQELTMRYPNDARLRLFGADNPDALRGVPFWGLGFDEYSQQSPSIFSEVLSKSLADHLGFAVFSGTIKGKNQLYRTNEIAKTNPNEWDYIWQDIDRTLASEDGATIEMLRQSLADDRKLVAQGMMTQAEFDQEWYLSVEAAIKGAYYATEMAQARKENRIKLVPHDSSLPVHTVWDLGVGPALAVGFWQKVTTETRLIDYWEGSGSEGITEAIAHIQHQTYVYGSHFAPHDITARELSTGKSRIELAAQLGLKFEVVPNIPVDDGIDAAKRMWPRMWINELKCRFFLDAVGQYRREWEDNRGMFKEKPYHDWTSHASDMLRYAALVEEKMTNEKPRVYNPPPVAPVSEYQGAHETTDADYEAWQKQVKKDFGMG